LAFIFHTAAQIRNSTAVGLAAIVLAACGSPASAPASTSPSAPASLDSAAAKPAAAPTGVAASAAAPASAKPSAASGSAAPSTAAEATKLALAYTAIIPTILPEWMALEAGIFKKNNLNVEMTYIESTKGLTAVIAGEAQAVVIGSSEVVSAAAGGADVVAATTTAAVYPYVLQVPASIKTVDDLRGKKVGISTFGSTSDIATKVALRKVGLDPAKDVSIIAVGSSVNRLAAMEAGAIQAGLGFLPDSLIMESKGFHTLVDMTTLDAHWSHGSDVFTRAFINSNRPAVQRYVDSITEALVRIKKDKPLAVQLMKKYEKIDDQHILDITYDYYAQKVYQIPPFPKQDQFTDSKNIMGETNEAVRNMDTSKIFDDSFVKNAAERGVDKQ
jgi:NitT/TauT family transport system substrate-binding protein